MYKLHTQCRACGFGSQNLPDGIKAERTSEKLIPVLDLGIQPLANDFRKQNESQAGYAPLKVLFCPRCSLAQLSVVVDPRILYSNYPYITSTSDMMLYHFQQLYHDLLQIKNGQLGNVLEIGSNDGALLAFLAHRGGVKFVQGIDPAENLCREAAHKNVPTVCSDWNIATADSMKSVRLFDTIIARHVFCHVDDWRSFIKAIEIVSNSETVVAIEVPYQADMLERNEFDTIYHEHLSYLSLQSVQYLLKDTMFYLSQIQSYAIHGGSKVLFLRRRENRPEPIIYDEPLNLELWGNFKSRTMKLIRDLTEFIRQRMHSKFCIFGASAKSTVLINACGFDRSNIQFICDNTPQKQYRFSPGSDISILDEGALLREMPDYTIMCCWNYKEEVLKKQRLYLEKGGKFIIPIPKFEVIDLHNAC